MIAISGKEETQMQWTIRMLEEWGEVSRNQALRTIYFSRLAARIGELKNEGWKIEQEDRDGDCVYRLVEAPKWKQGALI